MDFFGDMNENCDIALMISDDGISFKILIKFERFLRKKFEQFRIKKLHSYQPLDQKSTSQIISPFI